MALLNPPGRLLGTENAILSGIATRHEVPGFAGPLSIKAVVRGRAVWETDDGRFDVDASHVVVLNDGRRYSLTIDAREPVETLVACFRTGFVEDVARVRSASSGRLLDDPVLVRAVPFMETLQPRAHRLRAIMLGIRDALSAVQDQPLEMESRFVDLAVSLLEIEGEAVEQARRVPAVKAATRTELLRRVSRARDFIEAELASHLTLARIAQAACLSPYHCHRLFCAAFGETPQAYVTRRRLERARVLLASGRSVLEACLEVGFSSVGSFSSRYRATFGVSPSVDRVRV